MAILKLNKHDTLATYETDGINGRKAVEPQLNLTCISSIQFMYIRKKVTKLKMKYVAYSSD